jgi:POT family proton-dependent oligopeptide transporter
MDSIHNRHPEDGGSIFGHRPGLFVLFFTEMWERFSYYGMRALLVLFLIASITEEGGFGWPKKEALALYGIYTGLVYLTPMFGGIIADKFIGYRKAVIAGALIMTLGHASLAFETETAFYLGLGLLIVGNGLFKPNISSIVGQLYANDEDRKDSAYTIFYMGINSGAFLGIALCGYFGETWGWGWGFGLAGIFMFLGMLQFLFGQGIFGDIGLAPKEDDTVAEVADVTEVVEEDGGRIGKWAGIGAVVAVVVAILTVPSIRSMITGEDVEAVSGLLTFNYYMPALVFGAVVAFVGWIMSDPSLHGKERDRVWVIVILSFFIVFFWWAFEQAGGSMTIFAEQFTDRQLEGSGAYTYKIANAIITIVPMLVLTYVLIKLFNITFSRFSLSNIILGIAFIGVWFLIYTMLAEQFSNDNAEVPASWFQIFNSLFIIIFAPLFSKLWEAKIPALNSGPIKFAMGLTILGLGFAVLAVGALPIDDVETSTVKVSMFWLIAAYLLHTLGELCISPVGLSYVSKLAPVRLIGLMFGVFFVANFVANYFGGLTGSYMEDISKSFGLTGFFLLFAAVPITAAVVLVLLNGWMKKMMHGIE